MSQKKERIPQKTLGKTGLQVGILGWGCSPFGGNYGEVAEIEELQKLVAYGIERGVNFFDTSPFYGLLKSETVLGKCLKGIEREKFVVGTKIGRYGEKEFDFSAKRTRESVLRSLSLLRLDYIDIVQCHDIEFGDLQQVLNETLPELQKLKEEGLIHHVGITGLPLPMFEYVIQNSSVSIDVILSYTHYTLANTTLTSLTPLLKKNDIGIMNAAPLCMGILTNRGPPDWHPAPEEFKKAGAEAAKFCAEKGTDIAKLAVQFSLKFEDADTTIIGMKSSEDLEKNLKALEEEIDEELLKEVLKILEPVKDASWGSGNFPWPYKK